jgi:hypothetical protein
LTLNFKQRERLVTCIFLFLICLQEAHFAHEGWFFYAQTVATAARHPTQYADVFRIGIPALVQFTKKVFHTDDLPLIYGVLDLISGFLALYFLYLLTVDIPPGEPATPKDRALRILAFLAILQFPMAWIVPWQRPETLPSTLFLAICLYCLTKIATNPLWSLPILAATLVEITLRTDVPFVFGIAIVLAGLWTLFRHRSKTARSYVVIGTLIILLSGGFQAYLRSLYPNMKLDIQWKPNLTFHNFEVSAISLLPFIVFFVFLIIKRPPLQLLDKAAIACALLYFPVYFILGVLSEVRIYAPFLLILSMVAARVSASFLSSRSDGTVSAAAD